MREIVKILHVQSWTKSSKTHWRTTALLDNQEEANGYGKDYKVGDEVEAWWDEEYNQYKMQKGERDGSGDTGNNKS